METNNVKKPLLRVENLKQYFPVKKKSAFAEQLYVKANDGITLDIYEGETLGLVGESGCGKSTFGRTLLQLYKQTSGRSIYYGRDIDDLAPKYVEETLKYLNKYKKEAEACREKKRALEKELEASPENHQLREKFQKTKIHAENLFFDIVQLIGAFYLLDDLSKVSELLLKEYRGETQKIRMERRLEQLRGADRPNLPKIEEGERVIAQQEAELVEVRKEIYNLLEPLKKDPHFEKYESYRDKGINLAKLTEDEIRILRRDLQLIFQDPYSSLNPRFTVGQIIGEGPLAHKMFEKNGENLQNYILKTMDACGLAPYFIHRYPHQFSGGQRQRIGIARALALKPRFVVCDEAVSALDVSIQSQIINLLLDLKEQQNLTYLFISHDLSVIKYISDRVGVMYLGVIVEMADTESLFAHPTHPYTEALLSAIPTTERGPKKKEPILLNGDIPSPVNPPSGCKFHTRCRYATEICSQVEPLLEEVAPGHVVACHHKLGIIEEKAVEA